MQVYAQVPELAHVLVRLAEKIPEDKDVTAGGTAAVVFVLLILAVVVLGFSLTKQLRKAQAAKDAGRYDDPAGDPKGP